MRSHVVIFLLLCTLVSGCRKKPEPESAAAPGAESPASASTGLPEAPPPPAPPPPDAEGNASPEPPGPRQAALDFESLNTILGDYVAATDKVPKSLEEMVKLKLIPRLPTPPAGKKYVIDQQSRKVKMVNK